MSKRREDFPTIALLAIGIVICWLPLLAPYVFVADDYPQSGHGFLADNLSWQSIGIWRFAGFAFVRCILNAGAFSPPTIALGAHILSAILFYLVNRQGRIPRPVSLVTSLLFGVCPFAFEAMTFAAAAPIILATGLFFLSLLIAASPLFASRPLTQFSALAGLALAANLFQENLLFAFLLVPLWPAIVRSCAVGRWIGLTRAWLQLSWPVFGSWMGAGIFLVAYKVFQGEHPLKHTAFNWHVLASSIIYQSTGFFTLEPLIRAKTYSVLRDLYWPILAPASAVALTLFAIALSKLRTNFSVKGDTKGSVRLMIAWWSAVLFLTGAIMVFAGGMSLDSRKAYPFLPSLIGIAVFSLTFLSKPRLQEMLLKPVLLGTLVIFSLSTWLVVGIWRDNALRGQRLAAFILANHISGAIELIVKDPPTAGLKWFPRKLSFNPEDEWVVNVALGDRPKIRTAKSSQAQLLIYTNGAWSTLEMATPRP